MGLFEDESDSILGSHLLVDDTWHLVHVKNRAEVLQPHQSRMTIHSFCSLQDSQTAFYYDKRQSPRVALAAVC
jgi:hypothetical protein